MEHREQGRNEDDNLVARLGIDVFHQGRHPRRDVFASYRNPIFLFSPFQLKVDIVVQVFYRPFLCRGQTEVEYGILFPFRFQLLHLQSLEELLLSTEIGLEGAGEK